jgi:hypothetical protein
MFTTTCSSFLFAWLQRIFLLNGTTKGAKTKMLYNALLLKLKEMKIKAILASFLVSLGMPSHADKFIDAIHEYNEMTVALDNFNQEIEGYFSRLPRRLAVVFGSRYICQGQVDMGPEVIFESVMEHISENTLGQTYRWHGMREEVFKEYEDFEKAEHCNRLYVSNAQRGTTSVGDEMDYLVLLMQIHDNIGLRRLDMVKNNADVLRSRYD